MQNEAFWLALLASAVVASVLAALTVRRRGGSAASLRPPTDTPALNKIEMIKRYSEQYGVSMIEAKEAVEAQLARDSDERPIRPLKPKR
jgi:ribosomal protein L7/L12